MKLRVILSNVLVLTLLLTPWGTAPLPVSADNSTMCKWDFPWPRRVNYIIYTGSYHFTVGEADHVQYGANVWWDVGSNLMLERVWEGWRTTNNSRAYKQYLNNPDGTPAGNPAITVVYHGSPDCNRDAGRPITKAETPFNSHFRWHDDCLRAWEENGYNWCQANDYWDVQEVAAHEFGHWFFIGDHQFEWRWDETMYNIILDGETWRRSLHQHDIDMALIMYGRR